jgi:hypothetical protein
MCMMLSRLEKLFAVRGLGTIYVLPFKDVECVF